MVSVTQLPRDANGIVRGLWRVFHRSPSYTGQIGMCSFMRGVSRYPMYGIPLQSLLAVCGPDLFIAPWDGPIPAGKGLPGGFSSEIPQQALDQLAPIPSCYASAPPKPVEAPVAPPEPSEPPEARPDDSPVELDDMERPALFSKAVELGLSPHHKTGPARLRRMILSALDRD